MDLPVPKLLILFPDTFEGVRLATCICIEKMLHRMTGCQVSHLVQQLGCWVQVSAVRLWSVHIVKWWCQVGLQLHWSLSMSADLVLHLCHC